MNFNRFILIGLGALIGFLGTSSKAEAIAASVKTFGMAATGVAYPIDALAGAFNPAGNAEICDRLDLGVHWVRDQGHSTVRGNILDTTPPFSILLGGKVNGHFPGFKTKNFYAPDFGINKRLGCNDEWAIGLIVYNRNFNKTTFNKPFVLFGTSNPGLEYVHETISPIVAYKINECHNVGLSINYMVERIKVNGLEKLDRSPTAGNPLGSVRPGHVTNKGYNYSTGWSFTLGWQWHITDCITFGLTYQPKTSMSRMNKYKGFLAHKGRLDVPAMYSAGIAWRALECVTIAFDVQRYQWEEINSLHNPLLHKGRVELLGSRHGPGFGFRNQTFFRLGVDWQVTECLALRAGFRHANTPIRRSQTVVNQLTLDTVEDFVTAGATYAINPCHEFSTYVAYGFKHRVKGKNSIPPGLPAVIPGVQFGFGGGEADLTAQKFALGLAWGWNY